MRSGTDSAGHSAAAPAANAMALAECPLGKDVDCGMRCASRCAGTCVIEGRGRRWMRLDTWFAMRLVTAIETRPRAAPRRARGRPVSVIRPAITIHSTERSAARVSRGIVASSSGLFVPAMALNVATSSASIWRRTLRHRRVFPGSGVCVLR